MRHLLEPLDLRESELWDLLRLAKDIQNNREKYRSACSGKILATLFYEPSTRTRLSFESAMHRLGGAVLGFSSADASSASKGESVADTTAMISRYADIVAMRHPKEGAPTVAALCSDIPVINAGDGGHQHPTQTLTDLLTILNCKGRLDHLTIGLCGDLLYGRTVHSLIKSLSRHEGIRFLLISPSELRLPSYLPALLREKGIPYEEVTDLESALPELDVLYMTRIQKERFSDLEEYHRLKDSYVLDMEKLQKTKGDCIVLHPLPRVNEISTAVDKDPRAQYFYQAECGVYVRMALILMLLDIERGLGEKPVPAYTLVKKSVCTNPRCISSTEQEIAPFYKITEGGATCRCLYCEQD